MPLAVSRAGKISPCPISKPTRRSHCAKEACVPVVNPHSQRRPRVCRRSRASRTRARAATLSGAGTVSSRSKISTSARIPGLCPSVLVYCLAQRATNGTVAPPSPSYRSTVFPWTCLCYTPWSSPSRLRADATQTLPCHRVHREDPQLLAFMDSITAGRPCTGGEREQRVRGLFDNYLL